MSETLDRPRSALATIETLVPAVVFAAGGVEKIISGLERDARAEKFDASTIQGREACRSYAYKITRSKTALDDMGKDLTETWRKDTGAVNADRKIVRERLDALAVEVRAPLTSYEAAEVVRVEAHEAALALILPAPSGSGTPTAADLAGHLAVLRTLPPRDWQEFAARASELLVNEITRTGELHAAAVGREAEAAELAEFRAARAERDRIEAERVKAEAAALAARAQQDREAAIASQAAEAERTRAEGAAQAEQQAAAERERLADERAAQAIAQAAQQAAEAVTAERHRAETERLESEAQATRREANKANRARVLKAALAALVAAGVEKTAARLALETIAAGTVPAVSIAF